MHFRRLSVSRFLHEFSLGIETVHIVENQKHLGLYFRYNMDFNYTAKKVAQAANRSLGLFIANFKAFGGIPYTCFSKFYDAIVDSVIQYGSGIWGYRSFALYSP